MINRLILMARWIRSNRLICGDARGGVVRDNRKELRRNEIAVVLRQDGIIFGPQVNAHKDQTGSDDDS